MATVTVTPNPAEDAGQLSPDLLRDHLGARIPQLDGLRALAIISVIAVHSSGWLRSLHLEWLVSRGWSGVDLFFVLSGFLITGILLQSRQRNRYFFNFYARRALRIWPLYYLFLVLVFCVAIPLAHHNVLPASHANDHKPFWAYALYVQNLFNNPAPDQFLGITWSLAIEEQFYLVWPVAVLLFSPRSLVKLLSGIMVACPLVRFIAISRGVNVWTEYKFTLLHLDGLVAGCLLAIFIYKYSATTAQIRRIGWSALTLGGVSAIFVVPDASFSAPHPAFSYTAIAVLYGGLLCLALSSRGVLARGLSTRPLRYIGKISYCLYLVHFPIFALLRTPRMEQALHLPAGSAPNDMLLLITGVACSFVVAGLSWRVFEGPILSLRTRFEDTPVSRTQQQVAHS